MRDKENEFANVINQKDGELSQKNGELSQKDGELSQREIELSQKISELFQKETELGQNITELQQQKLLVEQLEAKLGELGISLGDIQDMKDKAHQEVAVLNSKNAQMLVSLEKTRREAEEKRSRLERMRREGGSRLAEVVSQATVDEIMRSRQVDILSAPPQGAGLSAATGFKNNYHSPPARYIFNPNDDLKSASLPMAIGRTEAERELKWLEAWTEMSKIVKATGGKCYVLCRENGGQIKLEGNRQRGEVSIMRLAEIEHDFVPY